MSLVSVILPTYNRRETIRAAIASVQRQSFQDWELIVVDDGSSDGTADLIAGLDPRLVLVRQENRGVNAARNAAMLRARGGYIAFLDSDDEWLPHHLELSVAFFRAHPEEDFLSGEFCEDGSPEGTAPFLHTALSHWYPPLAEAAGSALLDLPPGESDPYRKVFSRAEPIGAWGSEILERTPYRGVRLYRGRVFEHMRFGFLFALQPTVITRRAREATGLFDQRYRIGADYGYLARLCRRFKANFLSLPMAIKHERASDGTRLSEGHLSTGLTRFEFERDLLRQFEELFGAGRGAGSEVDALRRARQLVVGRAALSLGDRSEALRYLREAKHALWWLVRFAPTPAIAQGIDAGLRRARAVRSRWSERNRTLRADVERWGWGRGLLIRLAAVLSRCAGLHVYRINVRPLARQSPERYLPAGVTVRIATPEALLEAADDPELDLSREFVRDALARGDAAFGAFEDGRLVAYAWRTFTAAPDKDGLWARVERPYLYAYKAYTRPSHRGKRIHVAITFLADAYLLDRGYAFEVGYTETTNYSAIRVADLLGRRRIGYAGYVKWFGRPITFRTPAVRRMGAELFEPRPLQSAAASERGF